jgi:AraC-like DNA-binding protein
MATKMKFYSEKAGEGLQLDCVAGEDVMHNFPLHTHDSLCIGIITKGIRKFVLANEFLNVETDEIFVINPHQAHAIAQSEPHSYKAITVKGIICTCEYQNIIRSDVFKALFLRLFHAIAEHSDNLLKDWNELHDFLINNYLSNTPPVSLNKNMKQAIDFISGNYYKQLSIKEISRESCISEYYFCRLFKQKFGITPHNYLKQCRLRNANRCLQNKMPVFDTAIDSGFYDSSHFIRTFEAYMAVSPKTFSSSFIAK